MSANLINTNLRNGITLGLCVLAAIIALTLGHWLTRDRIEKARQQWLMQGLFEVLPAGPYDASPLAGIKWITAPELGSSEAMPLYRVYRDNEPLAAALSIVAPDGYNGDIRMLMGVGIDGHITGVRVLEHHETPGLGDDVEYPRSNWITRFNGLSLQGTSASDWTVRKQGGRFDAFTGATITPRAVINAIHRALGWFARNHEDLFDS